MYFPNFKKFTSIYPLLPLTENWFKIPLSLPCVLDFNILHWLWAWKNFSGFKSSFFQNIFKLFYGQHDDVYGNLNNFYHITRNLNKISTTLMPLEIIFMELDQLSRFFELCFETILLNFNHFWTIFVTLNTLQWYSFNFYFGSKKLKIL